MSRLIIATALLTCSVVSAQDTKQFVLAANRAGVVELLDPSSLQTLSRIHIDLPPHSVGLNGVSANADGSMIYVEGPIADESNCIDWRKGFGDQEGFGNQRNEQRSIAPLSRWPLAVRCEQLPGSGAQ